MVNEMMIWEPGDRLITLTADGVVRLWVVETDGSLVEVPFPLAQAEGAPDRLNGTPSADP